MAAAGASHSTSTKDAAFPYHRAPLRLYNSDPGKLDPLGLKQHEIPLVPDHNAYSLIRDRAAAAVSLLATSSETSSPTPASTAISASTSALSAPSPWTPGPRSSSRRWSLAAMITSTPSSPSVASRRSTADRRVAPSPNPRAASSASAQVIADVALCPFEAVKVRVQTRPNFAKGLGDGFPKLYAYEGLSGFYRGLLPLWGRNLPFSVVMFSTFEHSVDALYNSVLQKKKERCS